MKPFELTVCNVQAVVRAVAFFGSGRPTYNCVVQNKRTVAAENSRIAVAARWLRLVIPRFLARSLGVGDERKSALAIDLSTAATLKDVLYWLQIFFLGGHSDAGTRAEFPGRNYRRDDYLAVNEPDPRLGASFGDRGYSAWAALIL